MSAPEKSPVLEQLWKAVGEDRRTTYPVTVAPQLLLQSFDEVIRLSHEMEAARRQLEQVRSDRHALRCQSGGLQVQNARLRTQLATALELAEDRGVEISDEDIAEAIAARQRDDEGAA